MWAQEGIGEMDKWTVNTDCSSKKFGTQEDFLWVLMHMFNYVKLFR